MMGEDLLAPLNADPVNGQTVFTRIPSGSRRWFVTERLGMNKTNIRLFAVLLGVVPGSPSDLPC